MWGTEWPRFEVIKQDTEKSVPQMVGSVHATDPEHALLVARHVFVRRPSAYALFVAPAEAFFHVTQEALKDPKALEGPLGEEEAYWVFAKKSHRRSMVYGDLVGRFLAKSPGEAVKQALLEAQGVAFWAVPERLLAQRLSEWVAHAPILEENIAIANLAQDELGHAKLYLKLRRELDGSDPDELVFFRDPLEYQNAVLVELPKGDWAFTMVRQYLFDLYENLWLEEARKSAYPPLRRRPRGSSRRSAST